MYCFALRLHPVAWGSWAEAEEVQTQTKGLRWPSFNNTCSPSPPCPPFSKVNLHHNRLAKSRNIRYDSTPQLKILNSETFPERVITSAIKEKASIQALSLAQIIARA
jgi:hypothetical protein